MIIGVDIDGVLTDFFPFMKKHYKKFQLSHNLPVNQIKPSKSYYECFGWNDNIDDMFWHDNLWEYAKTNKPQRNASKILKKLHDDGHKIVIVSKRLFAGEDSENGKRMRKIIHDWFDKYKITCDKIELVPNRTKKSIYCLKNDVEIFIDDDTPNLDDISKVMPVICFDNIGNRTYQNDNMFRCKTWKEVYKVITNLAKEKKEDK